MEFFICKYCGKSYKNILSLRNHERYCNKNPNRQESPFVKYNKKHTSGEIPIWNKGLTKETNESVAKISKKLKDKYASGELIPSSLGRCHTNEEKEHLSVLRKEYLKNNPDKVPYLLNHHSKQSYPEKYFEKIFSNDDVLCKLKKEFKVGLYSLDFAFPEIKFYIEIDGEQHYLDERIIEHDKIRNEVLEKMGWYGIRIRWSEYQRKSFDERSILISNIKNYVNGNSENINIENNTNKIDYEYLREHWLLDKNNKINRKLKDKEIWLSRKELILNSGVNLSKFGWVEKVIKETGLTKRIIENTVKKFEDLQKIVFRRRHK